jgi:maleylpyruvate isomerase
MELEERAMSDPVLYGYWRSSAAYRVRIAANMKGVELDQEFVHLRRGEQRKPEHLKRNPAGLLPSWLEDGFLLNQSLAIVEYLDEMYPEPPLLPGGARDRAVIRELALMVVADIHPVANLRVLAELSSVYGADEKRRGDWCRRWIGLGFEAIEARLAATAGQFAYGDQPTLADICLVPQVYNARRFALDLKPFPRIVRIDEKARGLSAFEAAAPEFQPDAE